MTNLDQLRALLRYQTHAGYVWAAVASDGELICNKCACGNARLMLAATKKPRSDPQWECVGITHSGEHEGASVECAHCGGTVFETREG